MAKFQQHIYVYPSDNDLPGHIKMEWDEGALCGVSEDGLKDMASDSKIRRLKKFIEDRPICSECETAFRKILVQQSKLIDEWS